MKTRGVSIDQRLRKDGGISWDVRWRERIEGKSRQISIAFRDMMKARQFARETDDRLEIVRRGRSLMHDRMMAPQLLPIAIAEYEAEKTIEGKAGSKYPYDCRLYLIKMMKLHGWTHTNSVTEAGLALFKLDYARSAYSIWKVTNCWKIFLGWASTKYAIDASINNSFVKKPKHKRTYTWTEDERERILLELRRPLPDDYLITVKKKSPAYGRKIREYNKWRMRVALYPVIWLMVHWAPRPHEACALNVGNFDPITHRLSLVITKTGIPRSFIVDTATAELLIPLTIGRQADEPLFMSTRGTRCHQGFVSEKIKILLKELHILGYLYSARHHACTLLCQILKGNLAAVQEITGHEQLSQLNKYLHNIMSPDHAARAWDHQRQVILTSIPASTGLGYTAAIEPGADAHLPMRSLIPYRPAGRHLEYRPMDLAEPVATAGTEGPHET